jgi:hypothetical protein
MTLSEVESIMGERPGDYRTTPPRYHSDDGPSYFPLLRTRFGTLYDNGIRLTWEYREGTIEVWLKEQGVVHKRIVESLSAYRKSYIRELKTPCSPYLDWLPELF